MRVRGGDVTRRHWPRWFRRVRIAAKIAKRSIRADYSTPPPNLHHRSPMAGMPPGGRSQVDGPPPTPADTSKRFRKRRAPMD